MRPYGLQVHLITVSLALGASPLVHGQTASLSPTSMSFGNQAVLTTSASKSVKITNTSSTALVINSITPSNPSAPFSVSNNCTAPLALSAFCTITATFSPTVTGAASETLTVSDNSTTGSTQVINVSGTGVAQATVSPAALSFGNVAVGANKTMTVTLTNNLPTALSVTGATATGDYAVNTSVTGACGASIAAGGRCSIGVTFTPSVLGTRTGMLTISDSANTLSQSVNLTGSAITPATVSPTSLSFGNVVFGFNKTMTVTVTNNLPTAMVFNGASATGDYAVNNTVSGACGASIAGNGHCSIGVTFTPSLAGTRTGSLTIAAANTLVINLTGAGVGPASVSPASLSFGNVGVGVNSSTTTVTLTNNLSTSIAVGVPSATGDFAIKTAVSGPCGSTLAAGAHCAFGITFSPTQVGTRTGTLTIIEGAGNGPLSVPLTGTGTTSSLSSITLSPALPGIAVNTTQQFTATANFPSAISLNVTTSATWSSSSTTYATITSQGLATGVKAGATTIKATYGSKSASTTLTVFIPVTPLISWTLPSSISYGTPLSNTQLDAVALVNGLPVDGAYVYLPAAGTVLPIGSNNLTVQFTPSDTLHYNSTHGSTTQVVTKAPVTIIFSNLTVPFNGAAQQPTVTTSVGNLAYIITFNGSIAPLPVNVGSYTVVVTVNWFEYQGTGGPVTFTITPASPVFSNLASPSIGFGTSSIHLSGTISAGRAVPAGEQVTITINGQSVPAIVGPNGAFSATFPVSTIPISATAYPITYTYAGDGNLNPITDTTTSLTVGPPALVSLALSPQNPVIALGGSQSFTLKGTYTDGTTPDLTGTAAWSFSPPSANALTSLVSGVATAASSGCGGPVTITATSGALSASTTLMVGVPGGFACGANTTDARDPHTATLLNNGLILIAGGFGSDGSPLGSAELYDPVANTSTPTGGLVIPRANHTATLLNDGTVLIVGGVDTNGNPLASAEVYNPTIGRFISIPASLASARMNHTATLLNDGTVAIIGGAAAGIDLSTIEVFDPVAGAFSYPGGSSPTGLTLMRNSHTATLLSNGNVLVAGGYSGGLATNSAEIVTVSLSNVSTTSVSMTAARALHTATALNDGLVLIAGGVDDTGAPGNTAELFDPSAVSFTAVASMACSRASQTATELTNGTVLLAGGCSDPNNTAEIFDPGSTTFTSTAPSQLNTPRSLQTANLVHCACLEDGWVLLEDGVDSLSNVLNTTEWYQPLNPTPAGLTSPIQISPASASLNKGSWLQLTATGTVGSNPQVLNAVSWTSSDPTVVTITNDATNSGVLVPVNSGTATVTACAGTVCGTTTVTVN